MNAIDVISLHKTFTRKMFGKVDALSDVSFAVPEGRIFGFIGPNGAGKSTTIKTLMGLIFPASGETYLYGLPSRSPQSRRKVGYLAENPAYYDYLTPRELLRFIGKHFGLSPASLAGRIDDVLALTGMEKAADRPIRTLSKGMVQRVGLGQALVHDPLLYILDEPMSGLDPLGRRLMADVILDLKARGKTVFFSTHIIQDVERICDDVAILFDGRLKFVGSVKQIIDESFRRYEVILKGAVVSRQLEGLAGSIEMFAEAGHTRLLVKREELGALMQRHLADSEILSVEPERRTLESVFIDIVHGEEKCI